MSQAELPIDPPAEAQNCPELLDLMERGYRFCRAIQAAGVELGEENLLTPDEDRDWEAATIVIERLLVGADRRVFDVSRARREAEANARLLR